MLSLYLLMNSLIPVIISFLGLLWKKRPPQDINWFYGYRTKMSTKNLATWQFAHSYHSRILRLSGPIMLVLSILLVFIFKNSVEKVTVLNLALQVVVLLLSLIPTELALRRKFAGDGSPKDEG